MFRLLCHFVLIHTLDCGVFTRDFSYMFLTYLIHSLFALHLRCTTFALDLRLVCAPGWQDQQRRGLETWRPIHECLDDSGSVVTDGGKQWHHAKDSQDLRG